MLAVTAFPIDKFFNPSMNKYGYQEFARITREVLKVVLQETEGNSHPPELW
jgi:hypothetical protein